VEGGGWYVVIAVQRVRLKKPEKRHSLHGTDGIQKEKISEATTQSDRVRHRFGMRLVIFQCHHHHKRPKPFLVCDDDNNCMGLGAWIGYRVDDLEGIMTASEKLQTLRDHQAWRLGGDGPMTPPKDLTAAIDYAIQCCEAIQSRAKTLRNNEITVSGIYLAKTEAGDEVMPLTIRADQINLGTVFMGFTYQGPVEWVEE